MAAETLLAEWGRRGREALRGLGALAIAARRNGLFRRRINRSVRLFQDVKAAQTAEAQWRLDEAAGLWLAMRAEFPEAEICYAGLAGILRKLGRYAESGAVVMDGLALFPDAANLAVEQGLLPLALGDIEQAATVFMSVVERFPGEALGYAGAGKAYRMLLQFDRSDAVLARGMALQPDNVTLAAEHAATADVSGAWDEALRRWEAVRETFPDAPIAYAGAGAALRRLKRYDEADAVLASAMARFPDDSNLGINYAWVADERGHWAEALRRWNALQGRFGADPRVRTGLTESQGRASLAEIDRLTEASSAHDGSVVVLPPALLPLDDHPVEVSPAFRDLFMGFASLGENCEFGFAQRHFGAEPLGLLRWAGITFDKLMTGLETSFEGVGSAQSTVMELNPNNHEYFTSDRIYGLSMHTFITRDDGNEAAIYQKLCRRLAYLRDKLIEDLEDGDKIFVFQSVEPLGLDDSRRLHAAMRRYGRNALMCVRVADAAHAPGTLETLDEGLWTGFIDKVGFDGKVWNVSFDTWRSLCERVRILALEHRR